MAKSQKSWPIKELWEKYEEIAMHFNDLLIRLRIQALGGVAAITALVGIFAKNSDVQLSWEMAIGGFFILCLFWVSIWIIDFCYYNRLLVGAVVAILKLEEMSKTRTHIRHIELSTIIERAVAGKIPANWRLMKGHWFFYSLVFFSLLICLLFSCYQYRHIGPSLGIAK